MPILGLLVAVILGQSDPAPTLPPTPALPPPILSPNVRDQAFLVILLGSGAGGICAILGSLATNFFRPVLEQYGMRAKVADLTSRLDELTVERAKLQDWEHRQLQKRADVLDEMVGVIRVGNRLAELWLRKEAGADLDAINAALAVMTPPPSEPPPADDTPRPE